jgi:uncharacterized protein (TIGR00288 family)
MEDKLKIAVFIDFDNIEIGVKSTLQREFDVAAVLDALKERGEIVTKIAYANWGRQETSTRALAEHAVQMVQRDPSPRGDKNGADINLALDALEMAFTLDHINAFAIVSGDSDFIALVNKLKQYAKRIFVVSGRAFTSTILQKNCHEFISYESLLEETRPARDRDRPREPQQAHQQGQQPSGQQPQDAQQGHQRQHNRRPAPLDLAQAMPLVDRALQVLERREVRPQLGLLKSTMLQLDSTFNEKGVRRQLVHGLRGETAEGEFRHGHRRRGPLHDQAQQHGGREARAEARRGAADSARRAGNPPDGRRQRLDGRGPGGTGEEREAEFQLA